MIVKLPSKDELLEACNGTVRMNHPVLHTARKLAALHTARRIATHHNIHESDRSRADLVRAIDCWVVANLPQAGGASYLHTESVGMVIDRIAQYCVDAQTALNSPVAEPNRHFLWQRLAELAVAYTDLAFEISAGLRRLPTLTYPWTTLDAVNSRAREMDSWSSSGSCSPVRPREYDLPRTSLAEKRKAGSRRIPTRTSPAKPPTSRRLWALSSVASS